MGVTTIEWAHYTFNPWRGCEKISPGCKHCYAAAMDARWGNDNWGKDKPRPIASENYWRQPLRWNDAAARAGERKRVFCASMADVFEERPDLVEPRLRLFRLILATPQLDWMLLTKRPQNLETMLPWRSWSGLRPQQGDLGTPFPNVWIGTTVEDADHIWRAWMLARVPAAQRFVSVEPMLGPLELGLRLPMRDDERGYGWRTLGDRIHWVICGAESGHHARPMREDWVRALRDECQAAGVSFFYKQKLDGRKKVSLPLLDGRQWMETP